jgi:hypothetical protein
MSAASAANRWIASLMLVRAVHNCADDSDSGDRPGTPDANALASGAMRWGIVAALAAVALSGCGGGGNSNASKINRAKASEARASQIHAKLSGALQLHSYAGVDDSFTLPPGSPDVHQGESGEECDLDLITGDSDAVATNSGDEDVLVSPDKTASVKVGFFQGTPPSDCLDAVRKALGW